MKHRPHPLPTRAADELIYHIQTCPLCKRHSPHCRVRRDLAKKVLKERHGA